MRKPMSEENIVRFAKDTPDHLSAGAIWTSIKLTDIVDIDQTQIRDQYDDGVIEELKRIFNWQDPYGNDDKDKNYYPYALPEIVVVRCPQDKKKFWILDGHHRYQAALATGKETVRGMIVNNSGNIKSLKVNDIDDLRFLQARENEDAVATRTRETKRRQIIATMKKRPNWNLHQVAEYCNVSWQLAFAVHEELSTSGEHKLTSPGKKVQEAVGKPENASKSNRELAKELNVGEATVRRVRQNSKMKNDAPDAGKDAEKVGDCAGCLRLALKPYVVSLQNGKKLRFCSESCAEEYASREGLIFDADSARFFDNEEDFRNADALDRVSQKAQDYLKCSDPELEEHLKNKNWTEKQRKDFAEGIRAYHEHKNENSMPKTKNWADEKLDGYLYEEERQRQLEKNASDARALDNVSKKAQEFLDERAPAEPAKQQYQKPEVLDAPPASADSKPAPTVQTSKVVKSGSIPLKDVDNIQQIVDDVCDWLGDRVAAFAVLFQDKRSRTEDE